jgi:hypothetical protein
LRRLAQSTSKIFKASDYLCCILFAYRSGIFLVYRGGRSHVESGLLEIPDGVDMIVLQEVDPSDAIQIQDLQDEQSPMSIRRRMILSQRTSSLLMTNAASDAESGVSFLPNSTLP